MKWYRSDSNVPDDVYAKIGEQDSNLDNSFSKVMGMIFASVSLYGLSHKEAIIEMMRRIIEFVGRN